MEPLEQVTSVQLERFVGTSEFGVVLRQRVELGLLVVRIHLGLDLVEALERRGAEVLHAPALKIAPVQEDIRLIEDTKAVIKIKDIQQDRWRNGVHNNGSSTGGAVFDEAYVSVGDSTILSAGKKGSIMKFSEMTSNQSISGRVVTTSSKCGRRKPTPASAKLFVADESSSADDRPHGTDTPDG